MPIGVLALQGDVREHRAALEALGVDVVEVRRPEDLAGLEGIVLPGGESTTLSMLLESSGLFEPLSDALQTGLPAFGTCAGMILLAAKVEDGRPDQRYFGVLDCTVRRNGYGRQRFSFERWVEAGALDEALERDAAAATPPRDGAEPGGALRAEAEVGEGDDGRDGSLRAVFIRAPMVMAAGPEVEVLATLAGGTGDEDAPHEPGAADGPGEAVAVRQGHVLATTFHPELTGDRRLHRLFVAMTGRRPLEDR